jgi:DNA polymerase I
MVVDGALKLPATDLEALRQDIDLIRERLEPTPPGGSLLAELLELVTTEARTLEVVDSLPQTVGFDIETEPLPEHAPPPAWIPITTKGRLYARSKKSKDKTATDPHRARARLAQIYDPRTGVVYVIDLGLVPLEALGELWSRRLVIHNSAFEIAMLHGLPRDTICTMQMAGLVYGTQHGARRLATVAEKALGIVAPKDLQTSDWSAARLSEAQIEYAGLDAVLAYRIAPMLWRAMGPDAEPAFRAQNEAAPIIAGMGLRGLPFDIPTHLARIEVWEHEAAAAREAFRDATGEDVPQQGPKRAKWLQDRLTAMGPDGLERLRRWERTKTGALETGKAALERIADLDWVRPLIAVAKADQRLSGFGRKLIDAIHPVTGRLHGKLIPCEQKTGRTGARDPNVLGLPIEARQAVMADEGRVFLDADLAQIEMRAVAALSGDPVMRPAFADGKDLHWITGAGMVGVANPDALVAVTTAIKTLDDDLRLWLPTAVAAGVADADVLAAMRTLFGDAVDQHWVPGPDEVARLALIRKAAKPTNFGCGLYGQGARGLRATAWATYGVDMSLAEAEAARAALRARFPTLLAWQQRQISIGRWPGILRSKLGRPIRAEWCEGGEIGYSRSLNFAVQASACDVLLVALAKAAKALAGLDAQILLQVHDEIVVEASEAVASEAGARLAEAMADAWAEVFPGEPVDGIVEVKTVKCWADAKG